MRWQGWEWNWPGLCSIDAWLDLPLSWSAYVSLLSVPKQESGCSMKQTRSKMVANKYGNSPDLRKRFPNGW